MSMSNSISGSASGASSFRRTVVRTGWASLAALCGVAFIGAAWSADPDEPLRTVVSYGDLDLNSDAGAQRLYGRLQAAAKTVCKPLEGRDLRQALERRACVSEAIARAVTDVNQPTLTAYHSGIVGRGDSRIAIARSRAVR